MINEHTIKTRCHDQDEGVDLDKSGHSKEPFVHIPTVKTQRLLLCRLDKIGLSDKTWPFSGSPCQMNDDNNWASRRL